jgi:5-(aminomethyl)-3-furanmethanol phosphate kinase
MWVVKIGGSLNKNPLLPAWLELLAQLGGGRVTVVCGGGNFADEVRVSRSHWNFDHLPAHNMAILAMAQTAYLAHGVEPKLRLAVSESSIRQVLRAGHTALWLPLELLRDAPDADTAKAGSDSIALDLACKLNAEHLVLVKSCAIDPSASLADLGDAGVLDRRFVSGANSAGLPVDVVQCADLARMRALLHGDTKPVGTY